MSIKRLPAGSPKMTLQRVRLCFGSTLVQTSHRHPIAGTPTEVPVPSSIILPVMSVVSGSFFTRASLKKGNKIRPGKPLQYPTLSSTPRCQTEGVGAGLGGVVVWSAGQGINGSQNDRVILPTPASPSYRTQRCQEWVGLPIGRRHQVIWARKLRHLGEARPRG